MQYFGLKSLMFVGDKISDAKYYICISNVFCATLQFLGAHIELSQMIKHACHIT